MAKKDTLKQLELIDAIKTRMQLILQDLDELSRSIEESEQKAYDPSPAKGVTLLDVFKALEKRKHKNARFKITKCLTLCEYCF